jgi:hypothetical protein
LPALFFFADFLPDFLLVVRFAPARVAFFFALAVFLDALADFDLVDLLPLTRVFLAAAFFLGMRPASRTS